MADDYIIDAVTFAGDLIGGVVYPRVKLGWGLDGTFVDASATNPLPIGDAGGSLTVDGSLTNLATIGTSVTPGTAATNLGKAEDAGHSSGDVGVMALAVRKDAAATLAGTDLDYAPLQLDSAGALRVSGAGGGSQYAEDAVHASGDLGTVALVVRKDTSSQLAGTDGDYSILTNDSAGRLHANVGVIPAAEASTDSIGAAVLTSAVVDRTAAGTYTILTPKFAFANVTTGGQTDFNIVSAVALKKIRVLAFRLANGSSTSTLKFNSKPGGAGTAISELFSIGANGSINGSDFCPLGHFETSVGEGLTATTTGVAVGVGVVYVEVA